MLRQDLRLTVAPDSSGTTTPDGFLPNVRLPGSRAGAPLWTAASRAVRAPSRLDRDTYIPTLRIPAAGGRTFAPKSPTCTDGLSRAADLRLSYSVTLYHADYDHLRTAEIAPSRAFFILSIKCRATRPASKPGNLSGRATWRLSAGLSALRRG